MTLSFKFVTDCKKEHGELVSEAHVKYAPLIKYRTTQHATSKNIYEASNKKEADNFKQHADRVTELNQHIIDATGKRIWKPIPLVRKNVDSVMIWESAAYGVSDVGHTAGEITERLKAELERYSATLHLTTKDLALIDELKRQIVTFSRLPSTEEFRLRSKASIDTIVNVRFTDGRDPERIRLNKSGLFLVPKELPCGGFAAIKYDKSKGNLSSGSVYALVEPYNYYFAKKGNLYRVKDAERIKKESEVYGIESVINGDLRSKKV